ncbi:MAG TPA: hypothetical protein VIY48_03840 [Candidatus Paceibacterota bacterium]
MTTPMPIIRQDGTVAKPENPERRGFSREDFTGGANPSASQQSVHPSEARRLSGEIRPADLKDYNGPLFVINKMKDMISHDDGKGNVLRIEPVYHRDHITQLPIEVALHRGFQRLWRTGRVQVTTDPAIEDYLSLADSPEEMGGILPYTMDAGQNKDLTPLECLICHDQIFMSKEDSDAGSPALCDLHIDSVELIEQVRDINNNLVWKIRDNVLKRSL